MSPELDAAIQCADIVIMCGVSGSGKTELARQIERFGYRRVSADNLIWKSYGDEFPTFDAERRGRIFRNTAAEIEATVDNALSAGEKIVVDSTMCKRRKRDAIRDICRQHGAKPLFIHLDPSVEILLARLAMRTGSGPDDQKVSQEELLSFLNNFQRPTDDESDFITLH